MGVMVSARATERGIAERLQMRLAAPKVDWDAIARGKALRSAREGAAPLTNFHAAEWFAKAHDFIDDINSWIEFPVAKHRPIVRHICEMWNVRIDDVLGPRRAAQLTKARHHAIYEVARQCPWLSYPAIGRIFNRDHSSCISAVRLWPAKAAKLGVECLPCERLK